MPLLEIKVFCFLLILFLYIFKLCFSTLFETSNNATYLFICVGILASLVNDFIPDSDIATLTLGIYCLCFAVASFLLLQKQKEFISVPVTILIGAAAFFAFRAGLNVVMYVIVFASVTMFIIDQNKKIYLDKLTKIHNRHGLDHELQKQLRQYQRENTDLFYVISCDLDRFKQINDNWGHDEGDRALQLVATLLAKVSKQFRANVFRVGGDEFIIIADTSDASVADAITEAIKAALDNLVFRDDFVIQMSIGTAMYNGEDPIDTVIKKADKKLYEVKRAR